MRPKTVKQAVDLLAGELSDKDAESLKKMKQEDLIELHLTDFGMRVRNEMGLWGENEALLKACAKSGSVADADYASSVIIEALWKKLQ